MKPTRILFCVVLLTVSAGVAHSQNGCARLSWDTCDPWVQDKTFSGPGLYRVVESMSGLTDPNVGTDSQISFPFLFGGTPDAWRFDANGCQTGTQLSVSGSGAPGCPAMGSNPQTSYQFSYDTYLGTVSLHLTSSYSEFTPSPATRYTLWQITFDHSYSSVGPSPPDNSTCGGAQLSGQLNFDFAQVTPASGPPINLPPCDVHMEGFCGYLTWNGGMLTDHLGGPCSPVPVPVLPATWGRLKSLYR